MLRATIHKAGKALDHRNTEAASLRAQVEQLSQELEAHKPYTKRKVKESANDTFAKTEDIIEAQKASEKPPKRRKTAKITDPGPAVE